MEQEIAVELIGREDNQSLLFWEAAEGGIGVRERLIGEPKEFRTLAARALELLHFNSATGEPQLGWDEKCRAACYKLSYSNPPDHRHLNRHKVRDFLLSLSRSELAPVTEKASYEEQYHRLLRFVDPASSFERAFLDHLYQNGLQLPDHAQHTPAQDIAIQPDFYYERDGIPGVCIFVDGPRHDDPRQAERDCELREALKDQGFRVIAIRWDRTIADQISENSDVFGQSGREPN